MTATERRRKGRMLATAGSVPPEIQWQEGMLLMPQHFQQLARRQETLLHYRSALTAPYSWGVRFVNIDRALLPDGTFRVLELEAVMPDGLVVSASPEDAAGLTIDLNSLGETAKQKRTRIHLAVVAHGRGLPMGERYRTGDLDVVDENEGSETDVRVPYMMSILRPKLQLLPGDDAPAKVVSFPLAEVVHRDEKFVTTHYEPPWLQVAPRSVLYELCDDISSRVREKAVYLADQARALPGSTLALQVAETRALVHNLVGELPAFEALLRSETAHPFPLYLALCSLVGHVAGLSVALVPPQLDPYDHNDLYATFAQARAAIAKSLGEGALEAYTKHRFMRDGEAYRLRFQPGWMLRPLVLGVRLPAGSPRKDTEKWMDETLIGGASRMLSLRQLRVRGAARRSLDADAELAPPQGVMLYAPEADKKWVVPDEELVIVNPGDGQRPDEIVLYVKNET